MELLSEFPSTCCKDFPDKAGLIPSTEHILAWYKISSNPLLLTHFSPLVKKEHEIMKISEIYNDNLEFIWINPNNLIIFLCCTHINRNMRTPLHVWNFRKMHWSVFFSHMVLNFVILQEKGGKNFNAVWKVFILNNSITQPLNLE